MAEKRASKRTEKIQVMLDDEELAAIDDWRFARRAPSRAAAIRELIRRGLLTDQEFDPPPSDASTRDFSVTEPPKHD